MKNPQKLLSSRCHYSNSAMNSFVKTQDVMSIKISIEYEKKNKDVAIKKDQ